MMTRRRFWPMKLLRAATLGILASCAAATPAFADITAFFGANLTPSNRQTVGGAIGVAIVIVGFEFEYSHTTDDPAMKAPSLDVGSGNVFLQTPTAIFGFQPYFTTGGGVYKETLGTHDDTSFAFNTGGGVKISLIGPLKLRVDYRVFKLGSGALNSPAHRVYAGANLSF
jgi:opacity protein-like surface antigen